MVIVATVAVLLVGGIIGAAVQRLLDRRAHRAIRKSVAGPALSIAHPNPPLPRGSLAGEALRDRAWTLITKMRDKLDAIARDLESSEEAHESDTLTLIGLVCRVCVHEADHRIHEIEEIE